MTDKVYIDLEYIEKLYNESVNPNSPAREIFKAEFELKKFIPIMLEELKGLRGLISEMISHDQ